MAFNSIQFICFLPIVSIIYFLLPFRFRWLFLLLASCYFYMAFIPIYIFILFITILIDYTAAIMIEKANDQKARKFYLIGSIVSTCLVLFIFKYFNFFNWNLAHLAKFLSWNYPIKALNLILPIGLSFHTFQSLSYVIEVYYKRQKAERHFGVYALYVMFFPQLVAGPIERPQNLLPQLRKEHSFDYERVVRGLELILWGMFKKVFIADHLAIFVDQVYNGPTYHYNFDFLMATYFFSFQIYCDFSGYSDIAIGSAKILGIDLMQNFRQPYFSQSVIEFWQRWHISLSTWFKDYVYIPLGGNRVPRWRLYYNLFIVFTISGFWHGANWTYVVWGILNAFYLISNIILEITQKKFDPNLKFFYLPKIIKILLTFHLITFSWIFFRSSSITEAIYIIKHLLPPFMTAYSAQWYFLNYFDSVMGIAFLLVMDVLISRNKNNSLRDYLIHLPITVRWLAYMGLTLIIMNFGVAKEIPFIYFQF